MKIYVYYFIVISVLAVITTILDKHFAIKGKHRISENSLMCISALGGGFCMYITMLLIRHKTRHIKFMAGIPLIIVVQIAFLAFILNYLGII